MNLSRTVTLQGIEFEVEFDYTPEQKEVRYLANGDPGCEGIPESVEITSIEFKGVDMYEFMDYYGLIDALLERMEDDRNEN